MNYRKGINISGGAFLLFLILILIISLVDEADIDGTTTMQEVQVVDVHVGDIAAVAIKHGDVRFGLIHQPPTIVMEPALTDGELSQEEMQAFLYRLSKLKALGTIGLQQELSNYGLETPRSMVTLILRNGEKIRLALGDTNPVGESSYLLKEGAEDMLYLLSESDAFLLTAMPADFRDRSVIPRIELSELNLIREISLDFESPQREDFTIVNTSDFEFRLTEPFTNTLDYESVLSDMIFPLIALSPDRVLQSTDVPEILSPPDFRLSLLFGEERFDLTFREGETSYYIQRKDRGKVYEINKEAVPWGELRFRDLLKSSVYHVNISQIEHIQIRDGEKLYTLEIRGQSSEIQGELNGNRMEYPETMELYQALFSTGIADIVQGSEIPDKISEQEPEFAVTVFKKNGTIDTLEFFSRDREELFVAVNGEVHFTTYSRMIQALRGIVSRTAS